ncbi:three-helix bundle dimerization domain-containing protein [Yinghuangia soli]|uniref:Protein-tyrosine-phosphatase n=1 Tax=Yinghuangia soli TaxID=2908204 RepID=A0AA41U6Z1_9ACTN|nr:hypothetical protein [Yinghuangia soli]MCF2531449.1 hypothetical protein [Yinghuangia soli]
MASVADLVPKALTAGAVQRLAAAYAGVFPGRAVRAMVEDSYLPLAAYARVPNHLPRPAGRFAAQRLDPLAHSSADAAERGARALFVCTANSGRSESAAALFNHRAQGTAHAWSAGTAPATEIEHAVVARCARSAWTPARSSSSPSAPRRSRLPTSSSPSAAPTHRRCSKTEHP